MALKLHVTLLVSLLVSIIVAYYSSWLRRNLPDVVANWMIRAGVGYLIVIVTLSVMFQLFSVIVAVFVLKRPRKDEVARICAQGEKDLPGVSILKPLHGVPQRLRANLETFFLLTYPKYELLFCVETKSDPACLVVESLMKKYPKVNAKLFVGRTEWGINPKLCNLGDAYLAMTYDLFWIADANIAGSDCALYDMVDLATSSSKVALIHQAPFFQKSKLKPDPLGGGFFDTFCTIASIFS